MKLKVTFSDIIDVVMRNQRVMEACEEFASVKNDETALEDSHAIAIYSLIRAIKSATRWKFDVDNGGRVAGVGGLVAFPDSAIERPGIKVRSDLLVWSRDGEGCICGEIKRPKTAKALDDGSFLVETLTTHIGHDAEATIAISGKGMAVIWSERTADGEEIELHKFPEGYALAEANDTLLVRLMVLVLSLVSGRASGDESQGNDRPKPDSDRYLGSAQAMRRLESSILAGLEPQDQFHSHKNFQPLITVLNSDPNNSLLGDCEPSISDSSQATDPDNSPLPDLNDAELWKPFNIRAKDGSLVRLQRFRDDMNETLRERIVVDPLFFVED
jgi:hypothetical protein